MCVSVRLGPPRALVCLFVVLPFPGPARPSPLASFLRCSPSSPARSMESMLPCGAQSWHCGICPLGSIPAPDALGCESISSASYSNCRRCDDYGRRWVHCLGDCVSAPGPSPHAWRKRPIGPERTCLLTPAHSGHFENLALFLASLHRRALDTVPLYVVLDDRAQTRQWSDYLSRRARAAGADTLEPLAPAVVLTLHDDLEPRLPDSDQLLAALEIRAADQPCHWDGYQPRQIVGALKKIYGAAHLAVAGNCELVWVLDCDSLPLRSFHFGEIFRHAHTLLVTPQSALTSRKPVRLRPLGGRLHDENCSRVAERIHGATLSADVRQLGLRENDFWIWNVTLVRRMLKEATQAVAIRHWTDSSSPRPMQTPSDRPQHPPSSRSNASFITAERSNLTLLDAFLAGGLTTEVLVVHSWMIQRLREGGVPPSQLQLVHLSEQMEALQVCTRHTGATVPTAGYLLQRGAEAIDADCLGRLWAAVGQAGAWAMTFQPHAKWVTVAPELWTPSRLAAFMRHVPFCLSNCQRSGALLLEFRAAEALLYASRGGGGGGGGGGNSSGLAASVAGSSSGGHSGGAPNVSDSPWTDAGAKRASHHCARPASMSALGAYSAYAAGCPCDPNAALGLQGSTPPPASAAAGITAGTPNSTVLDELSMVVDCRTSMTESFGFFCEDAAAWARRKQIYLRRLRASEVDLHPASFIFWCAHDARMRPLLNSSL